MQIISVMWLQIMFGISMLLPSAHGNVISERQGDSSDFRICSPQGAATWSLGSFNSSWANLFNDIVSVVSGFSLNSPASTTVDPNDPARRDLSLAFYCSDVADCLLVPNYRIPMCWDRFTTNVYFPDGTYGTVVTGKFNKTNGDTIDLVYGDYTLRDGQTGNIYNGPSASSDKPVTATMPMPKQFTSVGLGSAIPATGLGATGLLMTVTSVVPVTTQQPSTGDPFTILASATDCHHCSASNTTVSGTTQSGTTRSESTLVYTTGIILPTATGIVLPTPPSQAYRVHADSTRLMVMTILLTTILFNIT